MDSNTPMRLPEVDASLQQLGEALAGTLGGDGVGGGLALPAGRDIDEASMLLGATALLHTLGLVGRGADNTFVTRARFARFAMASIIRMLGRGQSILKDVRDADASEYLISLTSALEKGRVAAAGSLERVDPVHERRIVNVLLKGRQIRRGRREEVYLHILHPEWRQYHLLGMSRSRDDISDEEIVTRIMSELLEVSPDRYSLDTTFNPPEILHKAISATTGAVTEYGVRLFRLRHLAGKLAFPKNQRDRFRWFTWYEIQQGQGIQGEPIMTVTTKILNAAVADGTAINVNDSDDLRSTFRIRDEVLNRVSFGTLALIISLLVLAVVCWVLTGIQDDTLDKMDKWGSVLSAVLGAAALGLSAIALRK